MSSSLPPVVDVGNPCIFFQQFNSVARHLGLLLNTGEAVTSGCHHAMIVIIWPWWQFFCLLPLSTPQAFAPVPLPQLHHRLFPVIFGPYYQIENNFYSSMQNFCKKFLGKLQEVSSASVENELSFPFLENPDLKSRSFDMENTDKFILKGNGYLGKGNSGSSLYC